MRIRTHLGYDIRVALDDLPDGVAPQLMDALTIPNKAKWEAQKQHQWGWQSMPDHSISGRSIEIASTCRAVSYRTTRKG